MTPNCNCGEPAKLVTVKKEGPNKGRKFYACAKPQVSQCDFFDWQDSPNQKNYGNSPVKTTNQIIVEKLDRILAIVEVLRDELPNKSQVGNEKTPF